MAAMTQYLKDKLVKHALTHTSYTSPTTVYLALYTTPPTATGGGTEVTGGSYARLSITAHLAFGATGSGTVSNDADLTITGMPACTVVGGAIMDASTSGNMLVFMSASTPRTFTAGQSATIATADLVVTFD
jgi:hypothetical protein